MNPNNLESKVVSLELAKRMADLGWKKKTHFVWLGMVALPGIYRIGQTSEVSTIRDDEYYASLSCEILEEFKNARFKPLMNTNVIIEIVQVKTHVVCLLKDVWDNVLHEEKSDVLVEALANLWNWYQENNKEE